MSTAVNTLNESSALVSCIDLSPIKFRISKDRKLNWTKEKIDFVEQQYRQFLTLWKIYPLEDLPPSEDVDEFWHAHILDTRKYFQDCEKIFGAYRHHFPYFGLRGKDDEEELEDRKSVV